jgi:taurine dioxygenase
MPRRSWWRGAQRLTPQQFVAWARRFGAPEPHVIDQFHHPADPNILILSNVTKDGQPQGLADAGTYFHTDYSYLDVPARVTTLYSIEAPRSAAIRSSPISTLRTTTCPPR